MVDAHGIPLAVLVSDANVHDAKMLLADAARHRRRHRRRRRHRAHPRQDARQAPSPTAQAAQAPCRHG
ncbi:MAG: hypothetical protein ACXWQ5_16980 [Ktedonobacterales bacterium]